MSQEGLDFFNKVVNPSGDWDISDAAVWADTVKRNPEYSHTANWHFIDARDDAPHHCQVVYKRDCDARDQCDSDKSPGCVVGAIASQVSVDVHDGVVTWQDAAKTDTSILGCSYRVR